MITIRNTTKTPRSKKMSHNFGSTLYKLWQFFFLLHNSFLHHWLNSSAQMISQTLDLTSSSKNDRCYSLRPPQLIWIMAWMYGNSTESFWYESLVKIPPTYFKQLNVLWKIYWISSIFVSTQFIRKRDASLFQFQY